MRWLFLTYLFSLVVLFGCVTNSEDRNTAIGKKEVQLYGTKASITLLENFQFSYEPIGYINYRNTIIIMATEMSSDRINQILVQLENSKSGWLKNGKQVYRFSYQNNNGWISYYYVIYNDEGMKPLFICAVDTNDMNEKEIYGYLNSIKITSKDENFNLAMDYYFDKPNEFVPREISNNSIIYTLKDEEIDSATVLMEVGHIDIKGLNPIGEEQEIMKRIVNQSIGNINVVNYDYQQKDLNGYCALEKYEYEINEKSVKGSIGIKIANNLVYYINLKSMFRNKDDYLDRDEELINNLHQKMWKGNKIIN